MDTFHLNAGIIERYASFARSFSEIAAPEILQQVTAFYEDQKFWPSPLITLNPRFQEGANVSELIRDGVLDPALDQMFVDQFGDPSPSYGTKVVAPSCGPNSTRGTLALSLAKQSLGPLDKAVTALEVAQNQRSEQLRLAERVVDDAQRFHPARVARHSDARR